MLKLVLWPHPTLPEKKGLVTIWHPVRPSDVSCLACKMTNHSTVRVISSAMRSCGIGICTESLVSCSPLVKGWGLGMRLWKAVECAAKCGLHNFVKLSVHRNWTLAAFWGSGAEHYSWKGVTKFTYDRYVEVYTKVIDHVILRRHCIRIRAKKPGIVLSKCMYTAKTVNWMRNTCPAM